LSTKAVRTNDAISGTSVARVDMKVEVVIPVSDVDRAKEFYFSKYRKINSLQMGEKIEFP
jgi:hypothetical protein